MLLGTEMFISFTSFEDFFIVTSILSIFNAIMWMTVVFGYHLAAIQFFFYVAFQYFFF